MPTPAAPTCPICLLSKNGTSGHTAPNDTGDSGNSVSALGPEPPQSIERALVPSNVRRFRDERFAMWRCPECHSLHASERVDLGHYYQHYPFLGARMDWRLRTVYRNQLRRLRRAGLRRSDRILDYGCGKGMFIHYLREQGYTDVSGYDFYTPGFEDPAPLERRYDFVYTQDVLEHVDDPGVLLDALARLVNPGGVIAIGTPDAAALDLQQIDRCIHALHQPYHRHIFSTFALHREGQRRGWSLLRHYPTMYTNTLTPFMSSRFGLHYFRCFDNTIDLAFEPVHANSLKLWTPLTLLYAFFGYFFAPKTDVMSLFRVGERP